MSDKDNKISGDEEYQYPNQEYVTETTPIEEQPVQEKQPNFFVRLIQRNKRVTVVIVIVLIALIGFKFFGGHKTPKSVAPPVAQQTIAQPPVVQPDPQVVDEIGNLKQSQQNDQATIGQLQNQVQNLETQINQTNAQQAQLNQGMTALVDQMKQLSENLQSLSQKKVKVVKKPMAPTPPPIVFHLKAIVPGRAWIVSNDGLSESVTTGNTIPQYGTVESVDANRGMVLTSSGKVIEYGPNDR